MVAELIETRNFQRIPLNLSVSGKCPGKLFRGYKFQGMTQNASFDGLCMKVSNSQFFKEGQ